MADYVVSVTGSNGFGAVDNVRQKLQDGGYVLSANFVATMAGGLRNPIGITFSVAGTAANNLTLTNQLLATSGVISASAT